MMLSRSREKFRSARHQILILQPLEKARSRSRGMERVSREMRGTGVQNGGGSVARRIRGDFSERTPDNPPRYIDTGFQYKHPAYFEFLNSRIRTRQRQSGSGWSGRTPAAARGRAARQKNASEMEFLSIMFMWMDSILDANAVSVGNQ